MSNPPDRKPANANADETSAPVQDNARRAWLWVVQYWKALFDFSFERYMIIQMLPILYGMMLFGLGAGIIYLVVEAFVNGSPWRAFFYLFFAGPLAFVVIASMLRAMLEFYIVIFRIAEDVDELVGIRDTVDKLSGLQETVGQMASITRRIPFWKVIVGKGGTSSSSSSRRLSAERREAEQKGGDGRPRDGKS